MATNTQIRLATRADANEIARLSKVLIEHGVGWSYKPARINRAIANKSRNVIVACCEKELVGFGIMSYKRNSANLDLLGVTRDHRRQGVGRSLLSWLEKSAATAGIVHHHIQVRKHNRSAIAFYSQFGYAVNNEIHGYYAGREAAVVMYKCTLDSVDYPDVDIEKYLRRDSSANRD